MKKIKSLLIILAVLIVSAFACACNTTPRTYTVTFPTNPVGYTVTGEATVTQGEDCNFTVSLATGYEKTPDFAVKVNGNEVIENEGVYTVENVSGNLTVTVEGVALKTLVVTLNSTNGYTIHGETTVTYGSNYTFTVEIANGYEKSSDFAVKVNGNEVNENGGVYTVENVVSALSVTVEGVVTTTYAVNIPTSEKFTVTGNTVVTYGSDYTFTVELASGYETTGDFVVKVNGEVVTANEGVYTVESVSENLTITVEGVVIKSYVVNIPTSEKFTVVGNETVNHFASYTFTVELATGYEKTADFIVKVNGNEVTENGGVYTVEGVDGELNITVEGIVYSGDINLGDGENENTDDWFNGQN